MDYHLIIESFWFYCGFCLNRILHYFPTCAQLILGKGSIEKKRFLSGITRIMGGGVYPCPNFLALFLEVHFWSIKRVYFFKNANVLNF